MRAPKHGGIHVAAQWQGTQIPTFEEIFDLCKGKYGMIPVVYSYQKYNTLPYDDDTIKYVRFTQGWIKEGDK